MKIKNIIKSCFLATIVFTWAACGGGTGGVDCAKDPTNAQCPLDCVKNPTDTRCPKVTIFPIKATIANYVLGTNNVVCTGATPSIALTITSDNVTAANFATAYPSGISATITAVPTAAFAGEPTLGPITLQINSITASQVIPVDPNGVAGIRKGVIYAATIVLKDVKNSPTNPDVTIPAFSVTWQ